MAIRRIEIPAASASAQEVELDGRVYRIGLRYNVRMDSWFMSIATASDEPLIRDVRIVLDYPLMFGKDYDDLLPPGEFYALCPTGRARTDPERNLGQDSSCVQLFYVESDT